MHKKWVGTLNGYNHYILLSVKKEFKKSNSWCKAISIVNRVNYILCSLERATQYIVTYRLERATEYIATYRLERVTQYIATYRLESNTIYSYLQA